MKKILLAMDTSSASQSALEEVSARPWPADASFEVVSVCEPSHLWTTADDIKESARCAHEVVRRAVENLASQGLKASGATPAGDPKAAILDHARGMGADLIIVGTHGVFGLSKLLLGSTARAVLRYAPCSVEIARAKDGGSASGGMRVLLATDGSGHAAEAARSIAGRPWPAGTEVRVLSAVELHLSTTRAFLEPPFVDAAFMEVARTNGMQRAQDAVAQTEQILSGTGLKVSDSISVLVDSPKTIILNEAKEWQADLIVVGSHGRHGVDRFLLGSVSEAVAVGADCSVDVIRKPA